MNDKMPENIKTHVSEHVTSWPATKDEMVAACSNMSDVSEEEKKWFTENLPNGTYKNPDEVVQALGNM